MPAPKKYEDWEEAARNSKRKVAVATVSVQGKSYWIIKPLNGNGFFTVKGNFAVKMRRKPTRKEIDQIRSWEAF